MMNLCLVVLIAIAGTALAATDAEPVTAKSVLANGVKAYVYNPLLLGTNGTMVRFCCRLLWSFDIVEWC